jgi:hypothetical protein
MEHQFNLSKKLIFSVAFSDEDLGLRKQDLFLAASVAFGAISVGILFVAMLLF